MEDEEKWSPLVSMASTDSCPLTGLLYVLVLGMLVEW
jgi:hypothetical protein